MNASVPPGRPHWRPSFLARVPGHQIADDLCHVTALRVAAHGVKECPPQSRLEPEGVTRVALRRHSLPFGCRDTRNHTTGLRCRATRSTLGVMTPNGPRSRLAAIPHKQASDVRFVDVPSRNGLIAYKNAVVTTACGQEQPTTMTTRRDDLVRCTDCKAATLNLEQQ